MSGERVTEAVAWLGYLRPFLQFAESEGIPWDGTPVPFLIVPILEKAGEKRLFGRRFVRLPRLIGAQLRAFEVGSIVGSAFQGRELLLAESLASEGNAVILEPALREQGQRMYFEYQRLKGREPSSMFDLFMTTEFEARGAPEFPAIAWKKRRLDLYSSYIPCLVAMTKGIGYGMMSLVAVEMLWDNSWGKPSSIKELKSQGVEFRGEESVTGLFVQKTFDQRMEAVLLDFCLAGAALFPGMETEWTRVAQEKARDARARYERAMRPEGA